MENRVNVLYAYYWRIKKGSHPKGVFSPYCKRIDIFVYAKRREEIPASPLDALTLNLNPLDAGQKRDTQFLVHVFIESPIDDRLLHQKGLVERQKFLLRSLIPGLRPEQQFLKVQAHHLAASL